MNAFDIAFGVTVDFEGALSNDPGDSGGITKYGISHASYPTIDIGALTLDQAKAIYRRDYWRPIGGDSLPLVVACVVFDAAVNNGVASACRWLQIAVGVVPDGIVGPQTLAAVAAADPVTIASAVHAVRAHFMIHLGDWAAFRDGWETRLATLPFRVWAARDAAALPPPSPAR